MKKRGKINYANVIYIVILTFSLAVSVLAGDLLSLQGNVDLSGSPVSSGGVVVEIWDGPDVAGSNLIYNSTDNFTGSSNISSGKFDIVLGDALDKEMLNLEYGKIYYMDLFIAGNDMNFSGKERQVFMSSVGTINSSFLNQTNNYTFSDSINISEDLEAGGVLFVDGRYGNVGIGEPNPLYDLHINKSSQSPNIAIESGNSNGYPFYRLKNPNAEWLIQLDGTSWSGDGDNQLVFRNDDATGGVYYTMVLQTGGNVGIGTTTPSSLLEVNGSAEWTKPFLNITNGTDDLMTFQGSNTTFDPNDNTLFIDFNSNKVGIGTTSPGATLEVTNTSALGATPLFNVSDGDDAIIVNATGTNFDSGTLFVDEVNNRVGIGTTSPGYKLDVQSSKASDWASQIQNTGSNGWGLLVKGSTTSADHWLFSVMDGTNHKFVVKGDGNVGIGTTTPTALLHIENASAAVSNAYLNISDGVDNWLTVDSTGKVVIGDYETPENSTMLLTIAGGDLNVSGAVFSQGLVLSSPFVVKSTDDEPIPICMKNSEGNWVGCMPDANNNWKCGHNEECDKKVLGLETTWKLKAEGASNEEVDRKVSNLRQKFEQGKSLATIKSELRAEVGDMEVLDELDDTMPSGKAYGIQTQDVPTDVSDDITALKAENELLKQRLAAIEEQLNSQTTAEPTPTEELAPTEEPAPTEQPAGPEQPPAEEPTPPEPEGPRFSITGASFWNFFSSINPFTH